MSKKHLTLGSLFDGSGGFPLAGCLCSAVPLWASEIEPYPIAVTRARFPDMKHLGSVTEINGAEIPPVDIITFGSPCQDMSVAGKRSGMQHKSRGDTDTTRSGLFYEAVRIIREMREATNGEYPAFAVWENVPGAFSSNHGHDFRCVLEELAKIAWGSVSIPMPADGKWLAAGEIVGDGFSIAWRVLDAQYWGVPQRRKRIYLVADFAGERAGKILFERDGMSGDPEPCEEAREGAADDAAGGAGGSCEVRCLNPWDHVYTLHDKATRNRGGGETRHDDGAGNGFGVQDDGTMYTIDTVCRHAVCYHEIARTLTARHDSSPCIGRWQSVVALDCRNLIGNEEISGTLQAKNEGGYSLNYINPVMLDARGNGDGEHVPTLTGDHQNRVTDYTAVCVCNGQLHNISMAGQMNTLDCMHDQQAVLTSGKPPRRYIVRRLTPMECCRLQGFPDGWADIPQKESMTNDDALFWENVLNTRNVINGKPEKRYAKASILKWYNKLHTDSAEYKMWGNGIALPCAVYVLEGIAEAITEKKIITDSKTR